MNLPADDHTAQSAEAATAPAAESGGVDETSTNADGPEKRGTGTGGGGTVGPGDEAGRTRAATAQRTATRRILDEVFGDVLPTVTRDELDDGSDLSSGGRDQWYRDNRPPHHG